MSDAPEQSGGQPGLRAWAANEFAPAAERARSMEPGSNEGTVRHPFPVVDRAEYLSRAKGAGIAALTHAAPIALVNLSDVHGIQESVNAERLRMHIDDPGIYAEGQRAAGHGALVDRPIVVKVGGKLIVHDGHHRLTAAHLRGQTTAKVRLVDLDGDAVPPPAT